jgi:hypothetical protein
MNLKVWIECMCVKVCVVFEDEEWRVWWWQVQCVVSTRVNLFTSKRKHNKVFLCLWCVVCLLDWVYCVVVVVESTSSPLCCLNNFLICDWKICIAYRGNRIHRYSMNISFLENFPENFVWLFFFFPIL